MQGLYSKAKAELSGNQRQDCTLKFVQTPRLYHNAFLFQLSSLTGLSAHRVCVLCNSSSCSSVINISFDNYMYSFYASVGGAPRHTVVVVFVRLSVCLSVCVLFCSALFSVTATN